MEVQLYFSRRSVCNCLFFVNFHISGASMPIFKNILLQATTIPVIICHLVIQYKKGQFFTKSTAIWVYHLLPNY